jgi:predicted alpha/beta-hydrolase family hydrolase
MLDLETPHGPARVDLHEADDPAAILVLGHGAGGGIHAPDLQVAKEAALAVNVSVALVEQPYRVAGKRSSPAASTLDSAWTAVIEQLPLDDLPLIAGGRSAGARVACRTANQTNAAAVLCLAFPLLPPRAAPEKTRQPELDQVKVPMLVVQGKSDMFGMPAPGGERTVVQVEGDHGLKKDLPAVKTATGDWLQRTLY